MELVFEHLAEWDHAIDQWEEKALQACKDALEEAGAKIIDEAHASFNTGAGPHTVTGHLAASIVVAEVKRDGFGYEATVGPAGVVYARRVELLHHKQHAYFEPGFGRAKPLLMEIFRKHWLMAQGGSGG